MELNPKWRYIVSRSRRLLPFDVKHCSPIVLRSIILDPRTSSTLLDEIAQIYYDDDYLLRDLVRCKNLSENTLAFISLTATDEIREFICSTRVIDVVMGDAPAAEEGAAAGAPRKKLSIQQVVQRMTPAQKVKLALSGGKDARGLLIRESNKIVSLAVLDNPRLTDGEVESFAQSQNLGEDIMRKIASNSEWLRKFTIVRSLVYNPKTPPGIAMTFVNRMPDKDLEMLEKSKNVSEAVRSAARGKLAKKRMGKN